MEIKIFQTKDEQDVFKMELSFIKKMLDNNELNGDLAETGVMWGGTAKIIREAIPDKSLYLFDTFTGLPNTIKRGVDPEHYREGDMTVDFERVKYTFKDDKNVFIHQGIFPQETSRFIENKKFAFVHLDVDIYQSTRDALIFFYPRMEIGGSIVIHDYPAHGGVKRAVDELMKGVGTPHLGKWKIWNKDPMVESGFRQLIIRRRIPNLKLNLEVPKEKFVRVYEFDKTLLKK